MSLYEFVYNLCESISKKISASNKEDTIFLIKIKTGKFIVEITVSVAINI